LGCVPCDEYSDVRDIPYAGSALGTVLVYMYRNGAHLRRLDQPEAGTSMGMHNTKKSNHTVMHGTFTTGALTTIAYR